jgi:hypothetical protein
MNVSLMSLSSNGGGGRSLAGEEPRSLLRDFVDFGRTGDGIGFSRIGFGGESGGSEEEGREVEGESRSE